MKILVVHNHYLEKGGEDEVVYSEINLLKKFGHKVNFYERSNTEINGISLFKKLCFFTKDIIWSDETYGEIKDLIKKERPDIAHIHNIFFLISPSIYYALSEENIPIVQSLHNYRFICSNGLFYKDGKICEKCVNNHFWPAVVNRCWRNSFFLTLLVTRVLKTHYKTFRGKINTYITMSEFSKNKFVEAGLPKEKIYIKPNFIDLQIKERKNVKDYALFVGRLADYKGLDTLISSYREIRNNFPLKIIGDGPLLKDMQAKIRKTNNIELLGRLPYDRTIKYIRNSAFVIFPSECYENMPRVIIESFACGIPVIASNIGPIKEIIQEGLTGLFFDYGDSKDLSIKIKYLMENKNLISKMGENACKIYEKKFSPEVNYSILMDIYNKTLRNSTANAL